MTAKLATAAMTADGTPGRRRISRSGAAGAARPCAARTVRFLELERDRPRIGADAEREDQPDERHRGRDEPGDDEGVELEVLSCEKRPEDERAERGAEQRPEEDVRDRPRLPLRRIHVRRGRAREQDAAVHRADADEAEDDERRVVRQAAQGRQGAADRPDDEAARDHRYAAESVHQAPRRKRRKCAGRQEDRRPEPEDRLDPRDEHERDRRDRDGELEDAREGQQAEAQQDRVTPDLLRARHSRAFRAP